MYEGKLLVRMALYCSRTLAIVWKHKDMDFQTGDKLIPQRCVQPFRWKSHSRHVTAVTLEKRRLY